MLTKTQCITLKSTPFKDSSKIVQVITKDFGIISIIVKGISKKSLALVRFTTPFTISEVLLKRNSSEIYSLEETAVIKENLHLRKDLKSLNAASMMIKALLDSHFPQKKTSGIFYLLKSYFKNILINPNAIYSSFLLKLLMYHGFINLKMNCTKCENASEVLQNGESLCKKHASNFDFTFLLDDFKKIFILCYAKSFDLLKDTEISADFSEKVNKVFHDLI